MERIKKIRGPVRASFTRTLNAFKAEAAKQDPDKQVIRGFMKQLEATHNRLEEQDILVIEAMVDEDEDENTILTEQEAIDCYSNEWRSINVIFEEQFQRDGSESSQYISVREADLKKRNFKLPKIELRKFNGDITEWLSWWAQFQKIHEDDALHASDKFQYLVQAMAEGTRARELVNSYPQSTENYPKVIQALQERFGKEKLLTQVYVRELLKMVINNAKSKEKVKLSKMFDKLESHLRALESLKVSRDQMSKFLYPMVESSIPEETLIAWQRSTMYEYDGSQEQPPKSELDYLIQFLKKEVEREEQRNFAKSGFEVTQDDRKKSESEKFSRKKSDLPTAACLFNGQEIGCIFCAKINHSSQECFRAAKMNTEEKKKKIKETRSCFICLRKGHPARVCKASVKCSKCGMKHYSVMCQGLEEKTEGTEGNGVQQLPEMPKSSTVTQMTLMNSHSNKIILMKTLVVMVQGSKGQQIRARLLFDEGSQRSYIRTEIAKRLNCPVVGKVSLQNNLFGGLMTEVKTRQNYRVTVSGINQQNRRELRLVNEDIICDHCPSIPQGPWIRELTEQQIFVTDTWTSSTTVDILIGSDFWGQLMTGRMYKLKTGLIAVESIFGWTLSGQIQTNGEVNCAALTINMLNHNERSLSELWSLEAIGIKDSTERITSEEHDMKVRTEFNEKIVKSSTGRYVVQLPWTGQECHLPSNQSVAEKRLMSCTSKLVSRGEFEKYSQIFRSWEREGIIEKAPTESESQGHFLPHRPVFKPESLTTPVRPVFDASCQVGKFPSLNKCLEKGPNLLEMIPAILLRFRKNEVGVVSDIRKAFQMVEVADEDRDYQKFLWWEDYEKKFLKVYRHCRVVFGLNCSPFILATVLVYHLDRVPREDKRTAELLKKSLYVDNCVISVPSKEEYEKFRQEATEILASARMDLRQWESSCEDSSNTKLSNVLGLKWDKYKDTLQVYIPEKEETDFVVTKRKVLSIASQVYDPLGFVCPALLQPKLMLQESWTQDVEWDSEWSQEMKQKFLNWSDQLPELEKIKIPRNSFGKGDRKNVQLHTFCDASKDAYSAVVFVRVGSECNVSVQLVSAKSRVAPLDKKKTKRVTIPRLELLGCLIGSRLTETVEKALELENVQKFYWSDSTTAIGWIRRDDDWGTFVGNRIKEIRKLTSGNQWRHVPGDMNPADLPSRGCTPNQLVESKWWEGPSWLRRVEDWPNLYPMADEKLIAEEKKKTSPVMISVEPQQPRFSSYLKNVAVAAWVRRFLINSKKNKEDRIVSKHPTTVEMRIGERDLIYQVQQVHSVSTIKLKNMDLEKRKDGLFHVRTRLVYKEDSELFKNPILLPKDDPMTHQLIDYVHRSHCHAGSQFVLGVLREKYWIPSGRKTVGRVIRKCVICRRHSSKSLPCDPAPLPQARVESQFSFQTTGVDLAGPLQLKGGKKVWIVLYTCAVYRGIFLDTVESLSTDEFLDSLEKFTLSVGRPCTIYSDNGTNFVGAQNLLKKLDRKRLEEKIHVKQIRWIFNPPSAPWWGGFWERLVRTVKELLRKMIGSAKLTKKELESCLLSISYTINNRPLTTVTADHEDLIPLTPAMFVKDLPIAGLPEREHIVGKDLQAAYKKIQAIKKALNERFRKEYLSLLIQRKNEKSCPVTRVGDIVLVGQENKKRYEWPLGRILELYPGRDGKIRVAKVKTTRGVLVRPLQRLYPLEVTTGYTEVPEEVKNLAEEENVTRNNQVDVEVPILKTRSGREVKAVARYGEWNH